MAELGLDPAIQTPEASWMPRSSLGVKVVLVAVSITETVLGPRRIGIGDIGAVLCTGAEPNGDDSSDPRKQ